MADLLAITKTKRDEARDEPDAQGNLYICYVIEPAVFYPAMAKHLLEAIEEERIPEELRDEVETPGIDPWAAARALYDRAKGCDFDDIAAPLGRRIPIGDPADYPEGKVPMRDEFPADNPKRLARAEALEICRLWFTRWLKQRVKAAFDGAGLLLKIERDEDYRL